MTCLPFQKGVCIHKICHEESKKYKHGETGTKNLQTERKKDKARKKGLSIKETCLRGRVAEWPSSCVAEINLGRCLPMSTTVAAAARSKPS